tara:strand:+ start:4133 stop:5062 length:930 start_codon:yes stop_codon:yes gene_type:complete
MSLAIKRFPLSIVIPTKDREKLLFKSLEFLNRNIFFFNEVIIIDSSAKKLTKEKLNNFNKNLNIKYYTSKPSTSLQRNLGLRNVRKKNKYVMFLDDDIEFNKDAFKKMLGFIKNNNNDIAGIGFNLISKFKYGKNLIERIKKSNIFSILGLYDSRPGIVTSSGWHTKAMNLKKNTQVEWLSTQACIYKLEKIKFTNFSNQLGDYAYLEDLFFSHQISKKGKLIIYYQAKYKDMLSIERNSFLFGIKEIKNRILFIEKNKLSKINFILGYFFFITRNFFSSILNVKKIMRFVGNIIGIFYLFKIKNFFKT